MPDLAPPECFTDWTVQARLKREWLNQRGFDYLEIDLEKQQFHWTQGAVPNVYCLFAVESPTPEMREKGYGHFVVGKVKVRNEQVEYHVVHDPLGPITKETAKYKVTAVGFFVRKDMS